MKKLKQSLIILMTVVLIMSATAFFGGCSNWQDYEFQEGDFLLEVSVDRTTVSIGDVVELTMTLINNSGRSLPVVFRHGTFPEERGKRLYGSFASSLSLDFRPAALNPAIGSTTRLTLRNGDSVSLTRRHTVEIFELKHEIYITHHANAWASFHIGRFRPGYGIAISGNIIELTII